MVPCNESWQKKRTYFFADHDYILFLKCLEETTEEYKIDIHAYVLMPNHYHMIVHTPQGNLSKAMKYLNGKYTQKINRKHKIDGSLFRGRYKSILIQEEKYLLELIRYIHRNPYKANLENEIGKYIWSSYKSYMSENNEDGWLKTKTVLIKFSEYDKEAKRKLKQFITQDTDKDLYDRLEGTNWPAILGGKDFKEKIKKIIQGKKIDREEITQYRKELEQIDKKDLKKKIKSLYGEEIFRSRLGGTIYKDAGILIYILKRDNILNNEELGDIFGSISKSAIIKRYNQTKEAIRKETIKKKDVKSIREKLL